MLSAVKYTSLELATCTLPTADTTALRSMTRPALSSIALDTMTGRPSSCCARQGSRPSSVTLLAVADCFSIRSSAHPSGPTTM